MGDKGREQPKTGIIREVNYLRGFAVLAVIAIHTTGYFTKIPRYNNLVLINLWLDVFSQFAVPLFILISGFVLAKNYRLKFSLRTFYLKRVRSIIPQYIIFSVAYTAFNDWQVMQNSSLIMNAKLLVKHILNSDASYHLWFFAIIIQLYILYPLIIKIHIFFEQKNKSELLLALLLLLQTLWMVGLHTTYFASFKINFIAYLFYFGMGIYCWDHFERLRNLGNSLTPVFLVTSIALTIGASFFIIIGLTTGYQYDNIPPYFFIGPELIYPILRIAAFLLFYNLARKLMGRRNVLKKVISNLGTHSFGIYLIHIFFNQYAIKILMNYTIDYTCVAFYPIVFAVTVILSYLAVRLICFLPISYYIIGYKAKRLPI